MQDVATTKHFVPNPNGNPAWVKGKSQNPAGRPKFTTMMTDCLVARLLHPADDKSPAKTKLQAVVKKLVEMAIAGDHASIETIYNRIEGKAVQPVDIEHKIGIVQIVLEAARLRSAADAVNTVSTQMIEHQAEPSLAMVSDAIASVTEHAQTIVSESDDATA